MANAMRNAVTSILLICCFFSIKLSAAQEIGMASMYSLKFQGSRTASGEVFSHQTMTAAHRTLPFNTLVKITRTDNGKYVIVKINDRGPFVSNRLTDISQAAASKLGFSNESDEVRVKLEVVNERSVPLSNPNNTIPKRSDTPLSMERMPMPAEKLENGEPKNVDNQAIPRSYNQIKRNESPTITATQKKNALPNVVPNSYNNYVKSKSVDAVGLYLNASKKGGFAVQVASLSSHENMTKKIQELKNQSYQNILVHIVKSKSGSTDYKILLGPFEDKNSADALLKNIQKKKIDGFVVNLKNLK